MKKPSLLLALLALANLSAVQASPTLTLRAIAQESTAAILKYRLELGGGHRGIKGSVSKAWPFSGKNRAQRQRLAAGFFAMS